MDQLISTFLSHTHYRYEVGMLKVIILASHDRFGRLPRISLSFSILIVSLVLTRGIPPHFHVGVINRHMDSPEFIRSRICVPMVFTAETSSARGQ